MFGIGMGPSGAQSQDAGMLGNIGKFGTSQGESDIMKSQNFWSSILSGDMSKISTVLGPQMSAINKQTQQRKMTTAQFGNRGGGTNATMANLDTGATTAIHDMISNMTGSAAKELGSMGSNLLSTGLEGSVAKFGADTTMHDENQAKWADIMKSIASIAGVAGGVVPGIGGTILKGVGGVLQS